METSEPKLKLAVTMPPIFSCPPQRYGGEIFPWDLCEGLAKLGVEVHLFAVPKSSVPTGGFLHYIPDCELLVFSVFEYSPIKFYKELIMSMDVVHDFTHNHVIHDFLFWHEKTNVISTPWGSWIQRPFYKNNVVTWSDFQKGLAVQQGYPKTTRWVHGCTNTDFYTPDPDRPYEKGDYFIFMARMHPDKRPDLFLKLAEAFPSENFVMSGSFGKEATPDHMYYGKMYSEMAEKLPNVTIIPDPSHEEKITLLRRAKALIHPSIKECFGLSIIEALACGTPAIISDDGAFPEIVKKGRTGWLCNSLTDYENAVRSVDSLSPEECRRDSEERWCRERTAKEYLKIYEDVAKGIIF